MANIRIQRRLFGCKMFTMFTRQQQNYIFRSHEKLCFSNLVTSSWKNNTNSRLTWATKEIGKWLKAYEDFVGVTGIKEAQQKVVEAERQFVEVQDLRREKQNEIQQIQFRLKEIHSEMDKVSRGEDLFYELFNKEHAVIRQEKELVKEMDTLERDEKQLFLLFSTAIRDTHETERVHSERTKYWPIIGSFVTFIGASLYGIYRFHKLQSILSETAGMGSAESAKFQGMLTDIGVSIRSQHDQLASFVSELKSLLAGEEGAGLVSSVAASADTDQSEADKMTVNVLAEIVNEIRDRNGNLSGDIDDIKKMIAAGTLTTGSDNVVYVGPEMRQLLADNERRLEFKIKANALATVASVYAAFAITLPLLYAIFKGGAT